MQELDDYHWLRVYHVLVQKCQELDSATEKPVYQCDEVKTSILAHQNSCACVVALAGAVNLFSRHGQSLCTVPGYAD